MIGVITDTVLTLIGSAIGFFFSKHIPEKWADSVMKGLALCVVFIGIAGSLEVNKVLSVVVSMLIGTLLGSWIDIDGKLEKLSAKFNKKFKTEPGKVSIAQGFVDGCVITCVGAMTAVGCLKAGLEGDNNILIMKAMLDSVTMLVVATSMGLGAVFTAAFILPFETLLVVLSRFLEPVLTDGVIADMGCTGSLLIIAIGFNLMGITKIKISNYLIAIFLPIGITPLVEWITGL